MARLRTRRADIDERIWNDMFHGLEDVEHLLPHVSMPVLLVWGEQDRVLDVSSVQVYERLLPRVQTHVFPGCGHAPIAEQPRRAARAYARFLGRFAHGAM